MCASPSAPPRSTNAPKLQMLLTIPLRICPICNSSSRTSRRWDRISRSATRSDRIKRFLRRSSSMILTLICWPTTSESFAFSSSSVSSAGPRRRLVSCERGTKPRGPTSTKTPPLLNSRMVASMIVPFSNMSSVARQTFSCAARRTERMAGPSPSGWTTYTSTLSPRAYDGFGSS